MDYLVATSPDLFDRTGPNVPSTHPRKINARRHFVSTRNGPVPLLTESSRKFAIGAFLPLPSISASPICSPTPSISPQDSVSEESVLKTPESEYITAPSSPFMSSGALSTPPTWISTPPTPPPGMVRRSVSCFPRSVLQVAPSASFPNTTFPHQNVYFVKRCNSVPPMPLRPPLTTSHSHQSNSSADITLVASTTGPSGRVSPFEERPPNRSKPPLFHLTNDISTDTEEYSPRLVSTTPEQLCEDLSVEGSYSDNESEDARQAEKAKDNVRRYHALKELLDTEVGYLLDLRALVTVYLRIIPTLVVRPPPTTTFSRASSSFTSSPWINAHTLATTSASSSAINSDGTAPLTSSPSKDPQRPTTRYLFTNLEVEVLTRNAEEILQLHEQFVRELRTEMAPLGLHLNASQRSADPVKTLSLAMRNTGTAIRIVSAKFAAECQAPRFASYQSFCTGHTEAVDLVRRIVAQRPAEWDAFEQRCSTLVEELELRTAEESAHHVFEEQKSRPVKDRSRAASMSSLEGAVRTLRSITPPAEGSSPRKEKSTPRLTFIDYMIKPVQRICKYPLILDQLRSGKSIRARQTSEGEVDAVVERAKEAMKHVAGAVDEARRRQDVAMQSALIASRISLPNPATMSSLDPMFMALSQPFISSLGTCLLAGSLDVVDHSAKRAGTSLSVKYLGAFLYLGGYLILVKVTKGKVYEPKHWLSLVEFDIDDVDDADAMLPYTICISYKDHRFDLAAACQREKDAWLQAIHESRNHTPTWINEPTTSLRFDGKGDLIPSALDDGPFELVNILPTIQSIPEFCGNDGLPALSDTVLMAFSGSDSRQRKSPRHQDDPLSRRSSTASVKGIFSPLSSDSETIIIRRYSASARSRVDYGLQDVISQLCLTARSYASFKDEELFPAPKASRGVFVRSQSALSITNMAAKSRLTRHESVRVLKRKSLIEKPDGLSSKKSSMSSGHSSRPSLKQSTAASSITAVSEPDPHTRPPSSCSPSIPSSSSARTSSPRVCSSPSKSSIRSSIFFSKASRETSPMKTSRSLVHGVKELLFSQSRSSSTLSLGQNESSDTDHGSKRRAGGSLRRWAKGSIHRRTQSAPNEESFVLPDIQKLPAISIPSLDLPGLDFGTTTTIPLSCEPKPYDSLQNTERLSADKSASRPSFIPSGRCQSPTMVDNHAPSKHTSSLLRRLKA
ncbi:hypothetical protein H0H92_010998 [Tricholoma furcatifolium]|nr:hypothetical protein H0H92_010998 [Tricholoma furcatifolium]